MKRVLVIAIALASLTVASSAMAVTRRATVKMSPSSYGRIITDARDHTLYLFTADKTKLSTCYGACARAWPPFLTRGKPRAGRGARKALLGTTRRRDGTTQVTYRGHPLYYYVGEKRGGQIFCQNVFEFGGDWLIVSPAGKAIR